jgi:parallel beta-helix repeat protein
MKRSLSLAACAVLAASAPAARGRTLEVSPGESIQAVVDRAEPGDTIAVHPGTYAGDGGLALVHVRKSGLRIEGARSAVIDARGYRYGILVGEDGPVGSGGCVAISVRSFTLEGLTVRSAAHAGMRLTGIDGFSVRGGAYLENGATGVAGVCSAHGLIARNYAAGHRDAAIQIANSDHVVVEDNAMTESGVGALVENSTFAVVRHNQIFGNAAGVVVIARPNLPLPLCDHVRIAENAIVQNDLPNPSPPDGSDGEGQVPTGSGILNAGADHVSIERNLILGNDSFGVATVANPFALVDPRIDPFVDDQRVAKNVVLLNGQSPDPERPGPPGADIVFVPNLLDFSTNTVLRVDPEPDDNCFGDNRSFTQQPAGVTESLACP